jgi:peptidoglycan/LPS O-acetylase OafA/YrhL
VLPYLAWTAIYFAYSIIGPARLQPSWNGLWADVVSGNAEYHLYFLLVILQLYVVFPALLKFVRRTSSQAWPILAAVAVLNLSWLAVLHSVPTPAGLPGFFWRHAYELLPTYFMYVLAGCYAALHLARLQSFAHQRRRVLTLGAVSAAALAVAAYVAQLGGRAPRDAGAVLQPAMVLSAAGAAILLYLAGSRWAAGPRPHEQALRTASDISFGVYLAHPLVLAVLLDHGLGAGQGIRSLVPTTVGFVVPLAGAAALTTVVRRTPASFVLAGRPRLRDRTRATRPAIGGSAIGRAQPVRRATALATAGDRT